MRAYERIKVARAAGVEPIMSSELLWALDEARSADDVRTIVLTGEGSAFCSGGDFAEMAAGVKEWKLARRGDYADLLLALVRSDKPVVARVNGHALGGGLGLVAASTFAVASTDAKLGTPEIDIGLFPMIIMAVLARHVPRRRLVEMSLLGQKFGAEEALELGLVNCAVSPDRLDAEVKKITDGIASKSPVVVRLGLRAVAAQEGLDLERSLPLLRERLMEVLATDDCREGLAAFLEKRAPVWTGK
jgi:enoyl-CoA hydratase/carnithine racemase